MILQEEYLYQCSSHWVYLTWYQTSRRRALLSAESHHTDKNRMEERETHTLDVFEGKVKETSLCETDKQTLHSIVCVKESTCSLYHILFHFLVPSRRGRKEAQQTVVGTSSNMHCNKGHFFPLCAFLSAFPWVLTLLCNLSSSSFSSSLIYILWRTTSTSPIESIIQANYFERSICVW